MLGLCGSHRTGKTTLAKAFAEGREEFTFLQTSASQVFRDIGLDPAVEYPMEVRLDVQERILKSFATQYRSLGGKLFIADRTPIDMLAYTLADVRQNNMTPELEKRLKKYMEDCINLTNEVFSILVIVQPGVEVVAAEGKASLSSGYIEHVAQLVMGLVASEKIQATHFFIPRRSTGLAKRVECVGHAYGKTIERHQMRIAAAKEAGSPIVFH